METSETYSGSLTQGPPGAVIITVLSTGSTSVFPDTQVLLHRRSLVSHHNGSAPRARQKNSMTSHAICGCGIPQTVAGTAPGGWNAGSDRLRDRTNSFLSGCGWTDQTVGCRCDAERSRCCVPAARCRSGSTTPLCWTCSRDCMVILPLRAVKKRISP